MKKILIREVQTESWEIVSQLSAKVTQGRIVINFDADNKADDLLDDDGQLDGLKLMKAIFDFLPKKDDV